MKQSVDCLLTAYPESFYKRDNENKKGNIFSSLRLQCNKCSSAHELNSSVRNYRRFVGKLLKENYKLRLLHVLTATKASLSWFQLFSRRVRRSSSVAKFGFVAVPQLSMAAAD